MILKPLKNSLLFRNIFTNLTIIVVLLASIVTVLYNLSAAKITDEIEQQIYLKLQIAKEEIERTREGQEQLLILLGRSTGSEDLLNGLESDEFGYQAEGLLKSYNQFMESVILISKSGIVVYDSNNNENINMDLSSREYFKESMNGRVAHSEILLSKATGNFIEVISVPVERDGMVIGVLATTMNIDYIKELLKDIKVEESGYAFLLDKNGNIIYHPNKEFINTNIKDFGIQELTDELVNMQEGKEGKIYYTFNGVKKMTLYIPIGSWSLSISAVKAEYLSAVNAMLTKILGVGLIMLVIASIVTALNSYFTVKKIQKVQQVMGRVTRGDMTAQVEEKHLKKCWEIMKCDKTNCIGYENDNLKCWEISSTLCRGEVQADAISKVENCKKCKVYKVSEGDELGQMTRSLSVMITTIRNLISGISQTSEQLSSSSQELSSASEETTASAEIISERMEEMSSSAQNQSEYVVNINAMTHDMNILLLDSITKINQMAHEAEVVNNRATMGDEKIGYAITGMVEIKNQTEKMDHVMGELIRQSTEIGEINDIITSIAEETNLLSLNASIEAARAGENGRGFGVVADEIGKLASQSKKSADGISILIGRITESIKSAHQLMDVETEFVHNGIGSVYESKTAFEEIAKEVYALLVGMNEVVSYVEKVKRSSISVTEAVEKMSGIIEESGTDIEEITASTQEQTSVSEEISNSASELARMAEELLESVSEFKI